MLLSASSRAITAHRRRIVAGYVVAAGAWVVGTDALSFGFGSGSVTEQTIKGLAFVAVTATVLAVLLRRHDRALHAEHVAHEDRDRQLELIAEFSGDVIYRIELAPRRFTFISPSVFTLLGFTPHEVLDDPAVADRFVHPDDRTLREQTADDAVIRLRWRHRNGRSVWTEQRNRLEEHDGIATAIVGVARDVTEQVLSESVHDACSRLDQLVLDGGSTDAGMLALGEDVCAVLEASRLRVSVDAGPGGLLDVEVVHDEPATDAERLVVTRGRACIELVPSAHTPSTEVVGSLMQGLLARIESSVHHEQRRRELERVEVALRATGIAIVLTDAAGQLTWSNEAFVRLAKLSTQEALDTSVATIFADTASEQGAELMGAIAAGRHVTTELQLARSDGSTFLAVMSTAPVRHADGSLEGSVVSIRDVTVERRVTDELHAAQLSVLRRQRDLERERTALVQTLSHELRTPLTVVLGAAQTLQRDALPIDSRARLVRSLERGTDDLLRHLDAVLAATDGLSGEVVATTGRAIVGLALERLASRHDLDRVRISGDAVWTGPATDAASLLRPLIHNALKFSADDVPVEVAISPGPPPGRRESGAPARAGTVYIDVVDQGPGIPPPMLPLLDRPFRQADSSITRPHAGLGLGLHAARRAADRLGARMATSSSAAGTRVHIELPLGTVLRQREPAALATPAAGDSRRN